jgi:hypothetical protein
MDGFDDLLAPSKRALEDNPFENPFAQHRSSSPDPWASFASQLEHNPFQALSRPPPPRPSNPSPRRPSLPLRRILWIQRSRQNQRCTPHLHLGTPTQFTASGSREDVVEEESQPPTDPVLESTPEPETKPTSGLGPAAPQPRTRAYACSRDNNSPTNHGTRITSVFERVCGILPRTFSKGIRGVSQTCPLRDISTRSSRSRRWFWRYVPECLSLRGRCSRWWMGISIIEFIRQRGVG